MTAAKMLLELLRTEITGETVTLPEGFDDQFSQVLTLAKRQDVTHLTYHAVKRSGWVPRDGALWESAERDMMKEIFRSTGNEAVLKTAVPILNSAGIPFVPLKGAVIRTWYPEPWMRASCDTDLLIREEDLDRALDALAAGGFTTDRVRHYHDVSLYLQGAHLELHFSICEDMPAIDRVLRRVWDYVVPADGAEYRQTPAFFAFHLVAHAMYHFQKGGCGVKPFLDLWILRKNGVYRDESLRPLLEECGITRFYEAMCEAVSAWFCGGESTDLTDEILQYVINGDTYGNFQNETVAGAAVRKSKIRYLLSRAFLPAETMKKIYPELKRRPILLPVCYVRRFWTHLAGEKRNSGRRKLRMILGQDPTVISRSADLFARLGLE